MKRKYEVIRRQMLQNRCALRTQQYTSTINQLWGISSDGFFKVFPSPAVKKRMLRPRSQRSIEISEALGNQIMTPSGFGDAISYMNWRR